MKLMLAVVIKKINNFEAHIAFKAKQLQDQHKNVAHKKT
jgi:hypothetical protein